MAMAIGSCEEIITMEQNAPTAISSHQLIDLSQIVVSKTNPRTHFDKGKLDELADSILRQGVIVPILVRPKGDRFELVAGERRFKAAGQVKLAQIPAIVRELDDKQTLEIQVIENLQREDLHPLEEAEGYARLIKSHGYDADSLAAKIGKSRSYVYARMKLAELCAEAKKAMWDGKISHSIGLLLARIPDAQLQREALKNIIPNQREAWRRDMSYRDAQEYIRREFMLRLHDAPWKKDDATLLPEAGPCTTCPFRTGNQKELFSDVDSADICTKPSCFQAKGLAFFNRKAADAGAAGAEVLTIEQSKKVLRHGYVDESSGYVEADKQCWSDSKNRTYRKLLGDSVQPVVAYDGEKHKVVEMYRLKDAKEALKENGVKHDRWSSSSRGSMNADRRHAEESRIKKQILGVVIAELIARSSKLTFTPKLFRLFATALAYHFRWQMDEVLVGRGQKKPNYQSREKAIKKFIADQKTDGQLIGVLGEVLFFRWNTENDEKKDLQDEFCKLAKIDIGGISKRIRADAAARKRQRKPKTAKATKKAKARR